MIITRNSSILTVKILDNLCSKLQAIKRKTVAMLSLVAMLLLTPCCFIGTAQAADAATDAENIAIDINTDGSTINSALDTWVTSHPGLQGPQGPAGQDGAQGPVGNDGKDGAQGPQGPAGNDGAQGLQGAQGPAGKDGAQGPAGKDGKDGTQGAQGPAGNDGVQGIQGPRGADGIAGATGARGPIGATGARGATGPQGPAGVSTGGLNYQAIATDIHQNSTGSTSGAIRQAIVDAIDDPNSDIHQSIAKSIKARVVAVDQGPSGVSILPVTEPKQMAAKVNHHLRGTALHKDAHAKFPNDADKRHDYLMPDSSNSKVIANHQAGNHILAHVNNRIANRSPLTPKPKFAVGVSSGAVATNVEIWTSAGYQKTKEAPQPNTDHSEIVAKVFSLGVDADLDDHATLGIGYAYVKSKVDIHGGQAGNKTDDDIRTNAVTVYLAVTEGVKQSSFAIMYAQNKHDGKIGSTPIDSYNSNIVGANYNYDYSLNQHRSKSNTSLVPEIILSSQLAVMAIKVNEHKNSSTGNIPKQQNVIFNFGVATTFVKQQQFKHNIQVLTKVKIGYNYVISSGDKAHEIELVANNPASRVNIKAKEPSANNLNLGLNFDCMISRNMHIDLDLHYSHGENTQAYGAGLIARYSF